jgi:hypothetical protein
MTGFTRSPFNENPNMLKEQILKEIVKGMRPEIPLGLNPRICKLIQACWRADPTKAFILCYY